MGSITLLLDRIRSGDKMAYDRLFEIVENELHRIADRLMANERSDHSLQATALVNEACLQLLKGDVPRKSPNRRYFYAAASKAMHQILINHARKNNRTIEGTGERHPLSIVLDDLERVQKVSFQVMEEALEELGNESPRLREIVELRFYSGLKMDEIAEILKISTRTVLRDWRLAKAVLSRILGFRSDPPDSDTDSDSEQNQDLT